MEAEIENKEKHKVIDIIKPEKLFVALNQYLALKVEENFKIDSLKEDMKAHKKLLKTLDAKIIETHRLIREYTIRNKALKGELKLEDFDEEALRQISIANIEDSDDE